MTKNLQAVIADDSVLVRKRVVTLLEEHDITAVAETTNVADTLTAVERWQPDILILDLHMPGNGMVALETIKLQGTAPIVIILTAFPYPQYRRKCLEAGADYFFDKATEFEQVGEVLQQLQQQNTNL
ncbi:MAG: response regulator [Chloroflexi bacterium]|nr:response regulator [Chloroflexota bacterium]